MFVSSVLSMFLFCTTFAKDAPRFLSRESNVTVVVGRDATLTCRVQDLQNYKVAWLRVDTQTILTIGIHVITKNHRVGVSRGDLQTWTLTLRHVRPADGGLYMCQINTEPMITQTHHLHVFVPPDIYSGSSGEVIVREGENVTLHCAASGTPESTITWRREDSKAISVGKLAVNKWSGVWLNLTSVGRDLNAAFLCIATNGVPPAVSKRIQLHVLCKPTVQTMQKMVGAYIGDATTLHCLVEAKPTPIVYWTHIDGLKLQNGKKYQSGIMSISYKHSSTLTIVNVSREDIGSYQCHAENAIGSAKDEVTLYTLATTTTTTSTQTVTTTLKEDTTTSAIVQPYVELEVSGRKEAKNSFPDHDFVIVISQHQMQSLDISPSS